MNAQDLKRAKEALAGIVGAESVLDGHTDLAEFQPGRAGTGKALLSVQPSDAKQVRSLIRLANESGLSLVFTSSGPPRFRGDSAPSSEAVIVDMSRMDGRSCRPT